eukprot:9201819-Pyramimonas_sp.AAC.1
MFTDAEHHIYLCYGSFHHLLNELTSAVILENLARLPCVCHDLQEAEQQRTQLHQRLKSWPPKRRRFNFSGTSTPDGSPPGSLEESAQALATHWGKVHSRGPGLHPRYEEIQGELTEDIPQIAPGIAWKINFGTVQGLSLIHI